MTYQPMLFPEEVEAVYVGHLRREGWWRESDIFDHMRGGGHHGPPPNWPVQDSGLLEDIRAKLATLATVEEES